MATPAGVLLRLDHVRLGTSGQPFFRRLFVLLRHPLFEIGPPKSVIAAYAKCGDLASLD